MLGRLSIAMTVGFLSAACGGDAPADEAAAPAEAPVAVAPAPAELAAAEEPAAAPSAEEAGYTDLTVQELQALLADSDPQLVNVHVPFEGDLPNTTMSIPYDQIGVHAEHIFVDQEAPIVVYCRSGRMSAIAAAELARQGYTKVYNLVGGFNAWTAAGLPMAEQP